MKKQVNGKRFISAQEFIRTWQAGPDVTTIARRTGMSNESASARAIGYRKHGVPLKKYLRGSGVRYNWSALAALAKECAK